MKVSPLTGHKPAAHRHNNDGHPDESPEHDRASLQSARAPPPLALRSQSPEVQLHSSHGPHQAAAFNLTGLTAN